MGPGPKASSEVGGRQSAKEPSPPTLREPSCVVGAATSSGDPWAIRVSGGPTRGSNGPPVPYSTRRTGSPATLAVHDVVSAGLDPAP